MQWEWMRRLWSDSHLHLDFGLFISFLGSTCCALLGFVLPVTFHIQICDHSSTSWSHRVALYCILALGVLACLAGLFNAAAHVL